MLLKFVMEIFDVQTKVVIFVKSVSLGQCQIRCFNQQFCMLQKVGQVSIRERFEIEIF